MTESKIYACIIVTTMILCSAVVFGFSGKIDYYKTIKLEKEFYEYAQKMSFYNEALSRAYEVMSIMPVNRLEYEGAIPVKAYLTDGSIKDIKWGN